MRRYLPRQRQRASPVRARRLLQYPRFRPIRHQSVAPMPCAQSSTTGIPMGSRCMRSLGTSAGCPNRWDAITARVRGVTRVATSRGLIVSDPPSTDAKMGTALRLRTAAPAAGQSYPGHMTSLPAPTPSASSATRSAALPEFTANAGRPSSIAENSRSNSLMAPRPVMLLVGEACFALQADIAP